MIRFNWFRLHPPYHTCVECERARLRRPVRAFLKRLVAICLLVTVIILVAIVLSDSLRNKLLDSVDLPADAPFTVLATPEPPSKDEVRDRAGFLSGQLILVEVASLSCLRGQKIMYEGRRALREKHPGMDISYLKDPNCIGDTRAAWQYLDDTEEMIYEIEQVCRRR